MCKGFKQLRSHLCGQFPKEKDAIYKYFDEIFQASKGAKAMIMMKIMPNFIYSKCAEYFDKLYGEYGTRSVIDVMQECGLSNETIGMLTYNWGDFGTLPSKAPFLLHALHIMHWMKGGWFPVHGPEQIAITILPTIEKPGGKCFVNARVSEIVLDKSGGVEGVLMNKGLFIPTTRVVSGVGAYNTYTKLLSDKATLPPQIRDTRNALTSQELPLGGTMMSLFIGLEGTVESLEVPKHNKWVFPTWDHDANQKRQDDEGLDAPFPVVYLSFSCAKDPKWAEKYPDTCVAEVLAPIPYSMFEEFEKSVHKKRNDSYDALKEVFQEKMMDVVYKRLPQFKGKVKYVNLGSPLTNNHYYNTHKGEVYALDHSLVRFSVHNQKNRLRPTTEIRGLYLTGQDVFMCGIMTAMYSGVMTVASMSWMALFKNLDILLRRVPSVYGETRVKSDGNEYGVLKDSAVFKILMVVIFAMLFRALLVG
ncbi:hypothetical protein SARC_00588 [Sphaeroforma arctica JP610]|uniref:Amine oxidase domain-containing protein n=1 Tax=Sphaeroforma arctica JP610 TaxID=667725 RepID=A0A0L0GE56_9EUKA|nr:hypothetical protein SARC_00588 [Sphaeroforma arctica JP610]KNC87307.1 hypothetical protein SARC_00588 [Sphaeroforma arctica JP610]|eukprot:XP_014161209.1 hypothetical protein SARC_00588 [Sphaeroforma arctica JP610]